MKKKSFFLFALLLLSSFMLNASQRFVVGEVFTQTW